MRTFDRKDVDSLLNHLTTAVAGELQVAGLIGVGRNKLSLIIVINFQSNFLPLLNKIFVS